MPSWDWYFPYHYAPFASDFIEIELAEANFETKTEPFKPFEQLMAVFPAASKKHIPEPWQILMTDENSSIIDFYPEDFQVDLNGKKQSWQGVALLPFVDEVRLKKTLQNYVHLLSSEEQKRNTRDFDRLFVGKSHALYSFFKEMYSNLNEPGKKYKKLKYAADMDTKLSGGIAGKVWYDEYVVLEGETYPSPIKYQCADIKNNQVLSVHFHDPIYEDEFIFKSCILEGAKIPEATLRPEDFESNQRGGYRPNLGFSNQRYQDYRQNRNATVANRFIQNSMGAQDQIPSLMSSANGGLDSLYGSYKSTNTNSSYQNQQNYQQYRNQSTYSYNTNYNRNSNQNRNYNQNQRNPNQGQGQGGYYNNNNNQRSNNYNYNNNRQGNGQNGANNRQNQHTRFDSNNQTGQGQGQNNQRQYNRQNTR